MTITEKITTSSGKQVELNLTIQAGKINGTAQHNGQTWTINGLAVVQGRKVLCMVNGPAPYLAISDYLYRVLAAEVAASTRAAMTAAEIAEDQRMTAEYLLRRDYSDPNSDL